jgi:steroid 5-alpha reductase family enzyme
VVLSFLTIYGADAGAISILMILLFEAVGDLQLARFKANPANEGDEGET